MKRVVFAWGRFNPPTIGHEKLLQAVERIAAGDDFFIYPTHTQDKKKNPLDSKTKSDLMKKMFPSMSGNIIYEPSTNTIIKALQGLQGKYKDCVLVAGSDRVQSYDTMISKYNGIEYTFRKLEVVSAGERDPDADGAEGMSASKMRSAAVQSDFKSFRAGMPSTISDTDCKKLMNQIRDIMLK